VGEARAESVAGLENRARLENLLVEARMRWPAEAGFHTSRDLNSHTGWCGVFAELVKGAGLNQGFHLFVEWLTPQKNRNP